jgi:hypothetical protein
METCTSRARETILMRGMMERVKHGTNRNSELDARSSATSWSVTTLLDAPSLLDANSHHAAASGFLGQKLIMPDRSS